MNKEIHNGYYVTGNHKALIGGREYRVQDASGNVLSVEKNKGLAVARAESMPEGDVKPEEQPEPKDAPKPAAKKEAKPKRADK